jgi:transposase InsO family protein
LTAILTATPVIRVPPDPSPYTPLSSASAIIHVPRPADRPVALGVSPLICGRLRDELLNVEVFDTVLEAKVLCEQWRRHYNGERPHGALRNLAPAEFALAATAEAR